MTIIPGFCDLLAGFPAHSFGDDLAIPLRALCDAHTAGALPHIDDAAGLADWLSQNVGDGFDDHAGLLWRLAALTMLPPPSA